MRCLGCKKIISIEEKLCPYCGYENESYEEPVLKKENMFVMSEKKEKDISDVLDIKPKKSKKKKLILEEKVEEQEAKEEQDDSNEEIQTYLDIIDDNIDEVVDKIAEDIMDIDEDVDKTTVLGVLVDDETNNEENEKIYVETEEEMALEKAMQDELVISGRYDDLEDDEAKEDDLDDTKEFNVDVSLDKTIAISVLDDTKELDNLSLIDDINKQIDKVNEENTLNEKISKTGAVEVNIKNINSNEVSDDNLKSRKKIFLITGLVVLIFLFTIIGGLVVISKQQRSESKVNYVDKIDEALQTYYDTEDIDDVIYILEEIKKDDNAVKQVTTKTKIICDSWILLYLNEEVENKDKFDKATTKYKGLIEGLYSYTLVKYKDNEIRALSYEDYIELINQIDNIYGDSAVFYDGLEFYNEKDYNKAYYMFSRVESDNSYYDKSVSYNNKIISNIIELLERDIEKIEKNMEQLSDRDKLKRYGDIEQIIIQYANVYYSVELKDSIEYKNILNKYSSKVNEYSAIVHNSN